MIFGERNGFWATAHCVARSDFSGDLGSFWERRGNVANNRSPRYPAVCDRERVSCKM